MNGIGVRLSVGRDFHELAAIRKFAYVALDVSDFPYLLLICPVRALYAFDSCWVVLGAENPNRSFRRVLDVICTSREKAVPGVKFHNKSPVTAQFLVYLTR